MKPDATNSMSQAKSMETQIMSDYDTFCDPYFFCYYNCKGGYCFFVRICDTIT